MGRGTPDVLTAWIPFGDIPLRRRRPDAARALAPHLAAAHRRLPATRTSTRYCENGPNADAVAARRHEVGALARRRTDWNGEITDDPHALARDWNTRWLTADFRMGDVLIFTHAHRPRRHRQRDRPAAALDRHPLPTAPTSRSTSAGSARPDRSRARRQAGQDLLIYWLLPAASPLCQNRCSSTNARIIGRIAISDPTIAA